MRSIKKSFFICLLALLSLSSTYLLAEEECTTAVVSGKATVDGRPLLWKNRDTDARKGGFGIAGMIGSFMKVTGGLIIDLPIAYSYCKMKPADYRINIGGFEVGIGIGYEF